jgi:photosystem II stability/assembly factor-like uncharacterized protein
LAFAVWGVWTGLAAAQSDVIPTELLTDAELGDVCFVDPDRGWVVGDRGVILHTEDGGRHWHLQHSPVDCRLESVCFLDDRTGWIVGGWSQPYTHKGHGVVLRTEDGGQHWEQIPRLSLPALRRVKFFDGRRGWAVAEPSDMYPAGVFHTEDGGLSWHSVPALGGASWVDGDSWDSRGGATGGYGGRIGSVTSGGVQPARAPESGLRNVRCLRFAPALTGPSGPAAYRVPGSVPFGWAVGDGGLVWLSVDGGRSWHEPLGGVPRDLQHFDFHAVATRGGACWIAGTPGTHVLHSADGGHSWQSYSTDQVLPIRALTFLDDNRGWAVGALGTILATRDGGRTWTLQRQGAARAALLAIFGQPQNIPLELLAGLAGDEGYVSVVDILSCTPPNASVTAARRLSQRTHEAVVAVGATAAETSWRFPLPEDRLPMSSETIVSSWDQGNAYGARERLLEHVVRSIRMWRPEVIVTEPPSLQGDAPLSQLVSQTVIAAVEKAASDGYTTETPALNGLPPWRVKKVYGAVGPEVAGTVNLTTSQLAPRLGCSLADRAQRGWQLLRTEYQAPPHTYGFRVLVNSLSEGAGRKDILSGISLLPGGEARRAHHAPPPSDLRSLTRAAQQRRNIDNLLEHLAAADRSGPAWLSQVENLVRGLDNAAAGEVLFQVAHKLREAGRPALAADIYDLLTRRCGQHACSDASLVWLVQYYASAEAAWAFGRPGERPDQFARGQTAPTNHYTPHDAGGVQQAIFLDPAVAQPASAGVNAATYVPDRDASTLLQRSERAALYGQLIRDTRPSLYAAPEIRLPMAQADRAIGRQREAEAYFHALSGSGLNPSWLACAGSELWLMQAARRAAKPTLRCLPAEQRPRLDGCLDDAVWTQGDPVPLSGAPGDDAAGPASAMLACDSEFLYLAASCQKTPGMTYSNSDGPRPRDADLTGRDRLELLIDVDRDYTTCYRLAVDHRGWVWEACLDIEAWNPEWYVAAAQDEDRWMIEVAIPFAQLVQSPPSQHDAWAVGLRRVVPQVGVQSWTPTTSTRVTPDAFGLLLFP